MARRRLPAGTPVRVRVAYSFPEGCPSHRWRWEGTMHGVPQPADRGRDRGASRGFDRSRSRDLDHGWRPLRGNDNDRDGRSLDRRDDDRAAAPPRPPPAARPGTLIDGVVDRGAFVRVPGDFPTVCCRRRSRIKPLDRATASAYGSWTKRAPKNGPAPPATFAPGLR